MKGWLILLVGWCLAGQPCSRTWADGGTLRLRERAGNYRVAVFTSPALLRAGPVDVSVLVQDVETGEQLPQTQVTVRLRKPGESAPTLEQPATIGAATNKLFHAAEFDLPHSGRWEVEVEIDGQRGKGLVRFEVEADDALPPWLEVWPWSAWPAAVVVLFGVHQLLVHRSKSKAKR
jgi:hypothetical protein